MKEFIDAYRALRGAGSPAHLNFMDKAAENGMVYTRGLLLDFREKLPLPRVPDPTKKGNSGRQFGTTYVRGTVKIDAVPLTGPNLGLEATSGVIAVKERHLLYKPFVAGPWAVEPVDKQQWTKTPAALPADDPQWDTTTAADGPYDMLVVTTSIHGWEDTLMPCYQGDVVAQSTEWGLKDSLTWFSIARPPAGAPVAERDKGIIVIDNTAPTVQNHTP